MNTKSKISILIAVTTALVTFACLGGGAPTSVPTNTTEPPQAPTQPSKPEGTVEIINTSSYVDGFNDYNVVGEIINNTDKVVEDITLSLAITDEAGTTLLKDSDDNPVDHIDISPYISVLAPGASTPFNYYISADEVQPASFEVTLKDYDPSSAPQLAEFNIENVQTSFIGDDVFLTGEVVNLTSDPMDVETLAGAVLDENDKILAANSTLTFSRYLYPTGDAQGRDHGPFIVKLFGPIENVMKWKVYVRTVTSTTVPTTDVNIDVTNSYFDSYGTYHLTGMLTNNGSSQISPAVISGLYLSDKTVFDAASLNIPLYLNAGESVPFDLNTFQTISYLPADQASPAEQIVRPDLYWTFTTDYEVISLEAKSSKATQNNSDWTVNGTVVNTSDQKLSSISVIVLFLDENQQVLATNTTAIYPAEDAEAIRPGDSNEFSVSIYAPEDWDLSSHDYQIILQGVVTE